MTDVEPRKLALTYEVTLPVKPGTERMTASERVCELNKGYFFNISFKNALGKKYSKSFKGEMAIKNHERNILIGWQIPDL